MIPPQNLYGTKTVKCQRAMPIIAHTKTLSATVASPWIPVALVGPTRRVARPVGRRRREWRWPLRGRR
jgi:hypothetical protein